MLNAFHESIESVAIFYAHAGKRPCEGNRIYAIGAMVLAPGQPARFFQSLVAYPYFSSLEKAQSGLTRKALQQAPTREDVQQRLDQFLGDTRVIAMLDHRGILDQVAGWCDGRRLVDLAFAVEFFLPYLDASSLPRLFAEVRGHPPAKLPVGVEEMVTFGRDLLAFIIRRRLDDTQFAGAPALRCHLAQSESLFGHLFLGLLENYAAYFEDLFAPVHQRECGDWKNYGPQVGARKIESSTPPTPDLPVKKLSEALISDLFTGLAEAGKGYQYRNAQVAYASHVAATLAENAITCLEAGTGTGKTQGYLLPLLSFLQRNPRCRAAVSTYTKNLQEQLHRELLAVREVFSHLQDVPVAVLKGKSGYLCAEKLDGLFDDRMVGQDRLVWLYLVNLVYHFRSADLDTISPKIRFWLDRERALSMAILEAAANSGCHPRHRQCPAQVAVAEARKARLVITNHHKLALLDKEPLLTDLFRHLIIDEANHFESAVRSAFSLEAGSMELQDGSRHLEGVLQRLARRSRSLPDEAIQARQAISTFRKECTRLHDVLLKIYSLPRNGEAQSLTVSHPAYRQGSLTHHLGVLEAAMREIAQVAALVDDESTCRRLRIQKRTAVRIRSAADRAAEAAGRLASLQVLASVDNYVSDFRLFRGHWSLRLRPVEVGELIGEAFYDRKDSIVYTAATLTFRNQFDEFQHIVGLSPDSDSQRPGLEDHPVQCVHLPSPFDPAAWRIEIPPRAVSGRFDNKETWLQRVAEWLPAQISQNRGRTLILCASYNDLNAIAAILEQALAESSYPLLVQRPGESTVALCDEFRSVRESVLIGVDTFWYGVDFKGDTLTQVVITRIPFPAPSDSLYQARREIFRGQRYWDRYYFETHIKLQQGIGRLIRSESDRGTVFVLDDRYRSRRWHR